MLQFIRSKAGSFVFRILFVLLIGSFGIWGIGDFLRQRPQDDAVIKVGSDNITGAELQRAVRQRIDALRPRMGGNLDMAQAKAFGIVDQVVDTMINRTLVDQEAAHENIVTSDRQLIAAIQRERAFQGPGGQFDKLTFQGVLAANHLTEQQYENSVRQDLPRQFAVQPILDGTAAPEVLADLLYKSQNEERVADWVYLPAAGIKDVPAPDDKAIQDYYDKHHADYTAPEYRGYDLLAMLPADVANDVKITDEQVADAYQSRVGEFTKVEKRHVLQMLLPDEKAANDAAQAVASGKDFTQIAKDVAKQDPATVDLGSVAKTDLPEGVADTAFGAKEGEVTKPAQGPFGWTILKISGIDPGGVKTLDEVKPQLEADLRKEAEGDALYKLSNKVEDAVSAGADTAQIAQQFNLKPIVVAATDQEGSAPDGKKIDTPPVPLQSLLKTVFDTPKDQVSGVQEVGSGDAFYLVKVDSVTPPTLKPLEQVKNQVKEAWIANERATRIAGQAKALADQVKPDAPLTKLAAAQKLQLTTTTPFKRSGGGHDVSLPPAMVAKLFDLQPGQAVAITGPAGQYVAQLTQVKPADPANDRNGVDKIVDTLKTDISGELRTQFEGALKQRYPVEIHKAALDALFATGQ